MPDRENETPTAKPLWQTPKIYVKPVAESELANLGPSTDNFVNS